MNKKEHVCPVWAGYILANPLRRLIHHPDKILSPYIQQGMKIVEIGPGMGFFSLPMARMTGSQGRVYCVDIQQAMLDKIVTKASKKGYGNIQVRIADKESFNIDDLKEQIDFVLLFAVVHEVNHEHILFEEIAACLKPGGKVLFAEPSGHVKPVQMEKSISIAQSFGLKKIHNLKIKSSLAVVLEKI